MVSADMLNAAMGKAEQELLADWYDDYHRLTFGIGFREAQSSAPNILELFRSWVASSKLEIEQGICIDFRYCERMRAAAAPIEILTALAAVLTSSFGMSDHGASSLAVLIVRHGLDKLCDCQSGS